MQLIRKDNADSSNATTQSEVVMGTAVDDSTSRNVAIVVSFLILFAVVIITSYLVIGFCYNRYQTRWVYNTVWMFVIFFYQNTHPALSFVEILAILDGQF